MIQFVGAMWMPGDDVQALLKYMDLPKVATVRSSKSFLVPDFIGPTLKCLVLNLASSFLFLKSLPCDILISNVSGLSI